jgi:hypothetical protein
LICAVPETFETWICDIRFLDVLSQLNVHIFMNF